MKSLGWLVGSTLLLVACGSQPPATPAPPPAPAPEPYSNLAQVMRGIPFPASNIIFDAQSEDPGAKKPEGAAGGGGGATSAYANVYGGWQAVENSALAIAESANLMMIPGRLCENGRPVPLDREDYRKFAVGLAEAGKAAYKAAQSKNMDAIVEVSGQVSDACAMCHEIYREKPDLKDRCVP